MEFLHFHFYLVYIVWKAKIICRIFDFSGHISNICGLATPLRAPGSHRSVWSVSILYFSVIINNYGLYGLFYRFSGRKCVLLSGNVVSGPRLVNRWLSLPVCRSLVVGLRPVMEGVRIIQEPSKWECTRIFVTGQSLTFCGLQLWDCFCGSSYFGAYVLPQDTSVLLSAH